MLKKKKRNKQDRQSDWSVKVVSVKADQNLFFIL